MVRTEESKSKELFFVKCWFQTFTIPSKFKTRRYLSETNFCLYVFLYLPLEIYVEKSAIEKRQIEVVAKDRKVGALR